MKLKLDVARELTLWAPPSGLGGPKRVTLGVTCAVILHTVMGAPHP